MVLGTSAENPFAAGLAALAARPALLDFFFSDRITFSEEIKAEMRLLDPQFRSRAANPHTRQETSLQAPFLVAHRVLTAFLEAYYVVAERLAAQPVDRPIDSGRLHRRMRQRRQAVPDAAAPAEPECVSRELFGSAMQLAANRNLIKPGSEGLAKRRSEFADELAALVTAVGEIDTLDRQRLPADLRAAA